MALAIVQHKSGVGSGSGTPGRPTLTSNPTVGNLLVCFMGQNSSIPGIPINTSGWTSFTNAFGGASGSGNSICNALYRYVQSGDTSANLPLMGASGSTFWSWVIYEISGVSGNFDSDFLSSVQTYFATTRNVTTHPMQTYGTDCLALVGGFRYNSSSLIALSGTGWTTDEAGGNSSNYGGWLGGHQFYSADKSLVTCDLDYLNSSSPRAFAVCILTSQPIPQEPYVVRSYMSLGANSHPTTQNIPCRAKTGNLQIVGMSVGTGTMPAFDASNWTQFATVTVSNIIIRLGYRYAQSGDDPKTIPNVCTTGSANWLLGYWEIGGVSGSWADDFQSFTSGTSTSATYNTTADTSTKPNALGLIYAMCFSGSQSPAFDSAWTQSVNFATGDNSPGFANIVHQYLGASGSNVQASVTNGGSTARNGYVQIVLLPSSGTTVVPGAGELEIEGYAPIVVSNTTVEPDAGELEIEGYAPIARELQIVQVDDVGRLEIQGYQPSLIYTAAVIPPTGHLEIKGYKAFVQEHNITEAVVLALGETIPDAQASEAAVLTLAEVNPVDRFSEAAVLTLGEVIPESRATEAVVLVLADARPCTSTKLHAWRITRRDGVVLRFTSLDVDYQWAGETFKACKSLNPSAADASSSLGDVGNIELAGLVSDESITEKDLYGGLYDDAFVEVWLLDFSGVELPKLLASGWAGNLTHSDSQFSMECLGAGARLNQTPITQNYTPGCRWIYGSLQCGFDKEALLVSGAIVRAKNRTEFTVALAVGSDSDRQWADGELRFTSGENEGIKCEIKDLVSGDADTVTLWSAAGFIPQPGDTFDMVPGCRRDVPTCQDTYDNFINYGGYPDVPGKDALIQTPDAKE